MILQQWTHTNDDDYIQHMPRSNYKMDATFLCRLQGKFLELMIVDELSYAIQFDINYSRREY